MKRQFGIRMGGLEEELEKLILHTAQNTDAPFVYGEIGLDHCLTFKTVYDILNDNGIDFKLIGFEMPDWRKHLEGHTRGLFENVPINVSYDVDIKDRVNIIAKDADNALKEIKDNFFNYIFVDGNHSYKSVTSNFLSLEKKVKNNGIVVFHDFCELCQGTDMQVGGDYINVRKALQELGLLDNKREGWKFVKEIPGSRFWGGEGNGCAVIQKI